MDKFTPVSSRQIPEAITRHLADGLFADVLWDQTAHPDLLRPFFLEDRGKYTALFLSGPFEHILSRSPFLWRINDESAQFLRHILIEQEPQVTIFISQAPFQTQKAHLQSLLEAYLPDGNCTHLRLYNDLVFRRLFGSCSTEDIIRLLGPNSAVVFPDEPGEVNNRESRWLYAENPSEADARRLAETYTPSESPWFRLKNEHFAPFAGAMRRVLVDNIVEDLWYDDTPRAAAIGQKYGSIEEFAATCVREGQAFGLENYEELKAYALLIAEFEAADGRREIAATIMAADAPPGARLARLRKALEGSAV